MRFDTDIVKKDRKRIVLTGFRGVDAASPVYAVEPYRASAMRNFISKNGNNHKRPGWRQFGRIKDASGNGLPINGLFKFTIAHKTINIAYAGTKFFMKEDDGAWQSMFDNNFIKNNIDTTRLKNRAVQMFIDNDKAYFIGCGDFLVLGVYSGELQFRRVYNDDNSYIPTTTGNISPEETDYYENGSVVEYGKRQTMRDVNILNSRRKNTLIGSDYYKNTETADAPATVPVIRTYKLDEKNLDVTPFEMVAKDYNEETGDNTEYKLSIGSLITATATRNLRADDVSAQRDLSGKTVKFDTDIKTLKNIGRLSLDNKQYLIKAHDFSVYGEPTSDANMLVLKYSLNGTATQFAIAKRLNENEAYSIIWKDSFNEDIKHLEIVVTAAGNNTYTLEDCNNIGEDGWNLTVSDMPARKYEIINARISSDPTDEKTKTCANSRKWGEIDFDEGKIYLAVHPHTISGEANITVTIAQDDARYANRILDCRFGALFGSKGNANTLFVSGCDDYPNYDYWSNAEDFTYFPSKNLCSIGTSSTRIMGYQRLGDESLAIFKEDSASEPTLYIRTGVATTISEDMTSVTEGYYLTTGKYITQGVVSMDAIGMLNGDALFLSKQGVFGVQINSDSIAIEQRVAKERSRLINTLLKKHKNLASAVSIVYNNKFYVAIDGYVYVADARFVFTQQGDMADTYNYEWWYWDNCPIRRFFVIDNELCFGTTDGRICVFDDEFTDRQYEQLNAVTFDLTNNRIQHDGVVADFVDGDLAYFKGSIYRLLFDSNSFILDATGANTKIAVTYDEIIKLHEGQVVYADSITGLGIELNTKYFISNIDVGTATFELSKESGEIISPTGTFRLLCDLNGEIVKVKAIKTLEGAKYIELYNRYDRTDDNGNAVEDRYILATYNNAAIDAKAFKYIVKNVVAEWYTPIMDMGASDYIKVLTRMTLAAQQITNGVIKIGYETKNAYGLKEIDSKGLDVFDFSNLNFGNFTFNTGFESSYTKHMKSDFNYILFRFISDNDCDCCVYSLTVEYKINRLNKGVW